MASQSGGEIKFAPVSLTMLVDGPVITGQYLKVVPLNPGQTPPVEMDIAADSAAALEAPAEVWEHYKNLVTQTNALFGAQHYRDYHFLYSLSDHVAHFGLEHHESNDSRLGERALVDPTKRLLGAGLLSHEFVHSWNGKYRRPADLATPDYEKPMQTDLLWVYEGLTHVPRRDPYRPHGRANAGTIPRLAGLHRRRSRPHVRDAPGATCRTPPTAFPRCRTRLASGSHGGVRSTTTKKMN